MLYCLLHKSLPKIGSFAQLSWFTFTLRMSHFHASLSCWCLCLSGGNWRFCWCCIVWHRNHCLPCLVLNARCLCRAIRASSTNWSFVQFQPMQATTLHWFYHCALTACIWPLRLPIFDWCCMTRPCPFVIGCNLTVLWVLAVARSQAPIMCSHLQTYAVVVPN